MDDRQQILFLLLGMFVTRNKRWHWAFPRSQRKVRLRTGEWSRGRESSSVNGTARSWTRHSVRSGYATPVISVCSF